MKGAPRVTWEGRIFSHQKTSEKIGESTENNELDLDEHIKSKNKQRCRGQISAVHSKWGEVERWSNLGKGSDSFQMKPGISEGEWIHHPLIHSFTHSTKELLLRSRHLLIG